MWNLGEYRKYPQRLADHLPWATLIAPGVMLNKDGSLQKTIAFRGPDLDSSTPYDRRSISVFTRLAWNAQGDLCTSCCEFTTNSISVACRCSGKEIHYRHGSGHRYRGVAVDVTDYIGRPSGNPDDSAIRREAAIS
jgi:hypothetical protein